jgi:ribosomal protein S21
MAINVQIDKNNNESSANVIRRFQKRVQNSGIVRRLRDNRYYKRIKSENVRRSARLKKLTKKTAYERLYKLGKTPEAPTRR